MTTGKRIVLATHGTLGDLHPYLALALELQARGHKPVIATSKCHCQKVEAAGVEFQAIRPNLSFDDRELHRRLTEPKRGLERVIREFMLPVLRMTYDDLLLPRDVIAIAYAPYAQILPRASVIVHHGGVGTTGQALRAGKPMLVMPFGGDQYDNGARIERLGAGRTIMRKQYTAERAAIELKELFDNPGYKERAGVLGRRVQSENGVQAACDAIDEQLNPAA